MKACRGYRRAIVALLAAVSAADVKVDLSKETVGQAAGVVRADGRHVGRSRRMATTRW